MQPIDENDGNDGVLRPISRRKGEEKHTHARAHATAVPRRAGGKGKGEKNKTQSPTKDTGPTVATNLPPPAPVGAVTSPSVRCFFPAGAAALSAALLAKIARGTRGTRGTRGEQRE